MTIVLYLLAIVVLLHSSLAIYGLASISFRRNVLTILAESVMIFMAVDAMISRRWDLLAFGMVFHKLWTVVELLRNTRSLRHLITVNLFMAIACLIIWLSDIWLLLPIAYTLYWLATFALLRRHAVLGLHSGKARA